MKVTITYKDSKRGEDQFECDLWTLDKQNSLLKLFRKEDTKVTLPFKPCVLIRLPEILKIEIERNEP